MKMLYVTLPDTDTARHIATALVEEHHAACVNILSPTLSIYRWNDQKEEAHEVTMLVKTDDTHVQQAMDRICAMHPYECPCILVIPIETAHQAFLEWVDDSLKSATL